MTKEKEIPELANNPAENRFERMSNERRVEWDKACQIQTMKCMMQILQNENW
ncbi:hypothetical protein [Chryseobacterium terrae]|uniref:Uncharacterized protein n=1 Tax=Chryseobacterium terrae TaxID=3163299 RepID=A0ABW8Y0G9_9FLAO